MSVSSAGTVRSTRNRSAVGRDASMRPIRSAADHRAALAEIDQLMPARKGTPEGDRLDVLVTLVEAGEARH
jgi:antitoxin component HigA of HigAB toxin-antitoxin module